MTPDKSVNMIKKNKLILINNLGKVQKFRTENVYFKLTMYVLNFRSRHYNVFKNLYNNFKI